MQRLLVNAGNSAREVRADLENFRQAYGEAAIEEIEALGFLPPAVLAQTKTRKKSRKARRMVRQPREPKAEAAKARKPRRQGVVDLLNHYLPHAVRKVGSGGAEFTAKEICASICNTVGSSATALLKVSDISNYLRKHGASLNLSSEIRSVADEGGTHPLMYYRLQSESATREEGGETTELPVDAAPQEAESSPAGPM